MKNARSDTTSAVNFGRKMRQEPDKKLHSARRVASGKATTATETTVRRLFRRAVILATITVIFLGCAHKVQSNGWRVAGYDNGAFSVEHNGMLYRGTCKQEINTPKDSRPATSNNDCHAVFDVMGAEMPDFAANSGAKVSGFLLNGQVDIVQYLPGATVTDELTITSVGPSR